MFTPILGPLSLAYDLPDLMGSVLFLRVCGIQGWGYPLDALIFQKQIGK